MSIIFITPRQACDDMGINYDTAQTCGHVSAQIQFLRRRKNLRFSHHKEVCPITEETLQDKLLDWAVETSATVKGIIRKCTVRISVI